MMRGNAVNLRLGRGGNGRGSFNPGSALAGVPASALGMIGLRNRYLMEDNSMLVKQSFAPIEGREVRILILGSMPGDASIAAGRYYAHPRNRFWPLMATLLGCVLPVDYEARCRMLQDHGIALWDVAGSAVRPGSMDSAMREERPNDIAGLMARHPELRVVAFNGQKAKQLFDRFFDRLPDLRYFSMPSTSPANASFSMTRLAERWKAMFDFGSVACPQI